MNKDILKTIKKKKIVSRYIYMFISLLISAILYNILILPSKIVTGGVNGISIITNYLYKFDPSVVIFLISVSLLIISFIFLGVEKTSASIIATFLYPLLVEITSWLKNYVSIDTTDLLVVSIFIGLIGGLANGLMNKAGFSNGGLPIISRILYHKFKISISKSTLIINLIVVAVGSIFFGTTMLMYAFIILYINSFVMDKVILGVSNNKAFYIITDEHETIKEYITEELKHTVTVFNTKGGFKNKSQKVLLTVVPSREYFKVTEGIKEIDSNSFFVASDAYEVKGAK